MTLVVLIPAYLAGHDLPRTLASLAGDPVPFDIVVVDDGSVPPLEVPETAGAHRIVTIRRDVNGGVAAALNTGLEFVLAQGYDLIARLDAGDMNEPDRLAMQVAFLAAHPAVALVGSATHHVDEELRPLYTTHYPEAHAAILARFAFRAPFSHGACLFRAAAVRTVGAYNPAYELGEDYDLFWRIAARFRCANLPDALMTRVESGASLSHARRGAMARVRLALQWRHLQWWSPRAWLGLARSLLLMAVPEAPLLAVKRVLGTVG